MDLSLVKEQALKLNALSTKELHKFYTESNRGESQDGSQITVYLRLFSKELVTSMEMAYAIELLLEKRYITSFDVSDAGERLYDEDAKRLDGSSAQSELPELLNHLDDIEVVDPLPWEKDPEASRNTYTVTSMFEEATRLKVELDYKSGKVASISEAQALRAILIEVDQLDLDTVVELRDAYLIMHWDSAA